MACNLSKDLSIPSYSDYEDDEQTNSKNNGSMEVEGSVLSEVTNDVLPNANSTMLHDSPVKTKPNAPARKPASKPRQHRNFKNGKINKIDRRTGRDLADTFYYRKNRLEQLAKDLYNLTGAAVEIRIKPLTDKSTKDTYYKSPSFDNWVPKTTKKRKPNDDDDTIAYEEE